MSSITRPRVTDATMHVPMLSGIESAPMSRNISMTATRLTRTATRPQRIERKSKDTIVNKMSAAPAKDDAWLSVIARVASASVSARPPTEWT